MREPTKQQLGLVKECLDVMESAEQNITNNIFLKHFFILQRILFSAFENRKLQFTFRCVAKQPVKQPKG